MSVSFSVFLDVTFFSTGSTQELSAAWFGKAKSSANGGGGGLEINISCQKLAVQELKEFILSLFVIP